MTFFEHAKSNGRMYLGKCCHSHLNSCWHILIVIKQGVLMLFIFQLQDEHSATDVPATQTTRVIQMPKHNYLRPADVNRAGAVVSKIRDSVQVLPTEISAHSSHGVKTVETVLTKVEPV